MLLSALLAAGVTVRLGQRDPTMQSSVVSPTSAPALVTVPGDPFALPMQAGARWKHPESIPGRAAGSCTVPRAGARDRRPAGAMARTVEPIATGAGLVDASAAIAFAVERDWLLTEGEPPHSTDGGRVMVAKMKPR